MKEILVVNDDGIGAEGIIRLAALAKRLGHVTVVAPEKQCSAMSHMISIDYPIRVSRADDFPVDGVDAYKLRGTPADCAMLGTTSILEKKPDLVLSGINDGVNVGYDTIYSGTVAGAREALIQGVPGVAFSVIRRSFGSGDFASKFAKEEDLRFAVVEKYFDDIMDYIFKNPAPAGELYNLNFPIGDPALVKGVSYGVPCAKKEFYGIESFRREQPEDGVFLYYPNGSFPETAPEGTDMHAVINGYVAVGTVQCPVLM